MKIDHWRVINAMGERVEHAYSSDLQLVGTVRMDGYGDWRAEMHQCRPGVWIGVYQTADRARAALASRLALSSEE